jgi:dTMP kinase
MDAWVERLGGRFIVFDGPDGSGKSTQFERFARRCEEAGLPVCTVREPGGTAVGEQVRRILLDPANTEMGVRCEMLLYMASRAQLVEQIIRPALAQGSLVLADRFISSTLAYQGTAGGLDPEEIRRVGLVAVGETWPDLTIIFDVPAAVAATRISENRDRLEQRDAEYHRRVRQGFLDQAAAAPDSYIVIDASPDEDTVFAALVAELSARMT